MPDVPEVKASGDPMSVMVSHVMPTIASDVIAQVAATRARNSSLLPISKLPEAGIRTPIRRRAQQQIQCRGCRDRCCGHDRRRGGRGEPGRCCRGGGG